MRYAMSSINTKQIYEPGSEKNILKHGSRGGWGKSREGKKRSFVVKNNFCFVISQWKF